MYFALEREGQPSKKKKKDQCCPKSMDALLKKQPFFFGKYRA